MRPRHASRTHQPQRIPNDVTESTTFVETEQSAPDPPGPRLPVARPDTPNAESPWSSDESVSQELEEQDEEFLSILLSEPDEFERRIVEFLFENPDDSAPPDRLSSEQGEAPENVDTSSARSAGTDEENMDQDRPTIVSVDLSTDDSSEDSTHGFRRAARERLRARALPLEPLDVPQNEELQTIIRFNTDDFGFEEERQRFVSVDLSSASTSEVYTGEDAAPPDDTRAIFAEIDEHNAGLDEWLRPDPVVGTLEQQSTRSSQAPVGTFRPEQVVEIDEVNADLGEWREGEARNQSAGNEIYRKKHRVTVPLKSTLGTF